MKPIEGTAHYGVHKDLVGEQIDHQATVRDAYDFVGVLGQAFVDSHPELEFIDSQVIDMIFKHPEGHMVQRVEWQALAKEKADATR